MSKRKSHKPVFKVRVTLEASQNEQTIAALANHFGVYPGCINQWKNARWRMRLKFLSADVNRHRQWIPSKSKA